MSSERITGGSPVPRMTPDELEFSISQYADGTLPAAEAAALERRLESDAEARALLEQYRKLDGVLKSAGKTGPEVRWDRLAESISRAIDEETEAEQPESYPMPWVRWTTRVAIAACLLIGLGVGIRMLTIRKSIDVAHVPTPPEQPLAAVVEVQGPQVETSTAAAVTDVAIGPAAQDGGEPTIVRYADGVVSRPSRVIIASDIESYDPDRGMY